MGVLGVNNLALGAPRSWLCIPSIPGHWREHWFRDPRLELRILGLLFTGLQPLAAHDQVERFVNRPATM